MAFTVKDFQDLLQLLREHQEWREQLRALILTEELLRLPSEFRAFRDEVFEAFRRETEARFQALVEAQRRTEERVEQLAEAQRRTEERVEQLAEAQRRTEERLEQLAEAQRRTEEELKELAKTVAALVEAQRRLEERLERMEGRILRRLNAFGARWGMRSEAAWRAGMLAILHHVGFQVERWQAFDEQGEVFGYPAFVELDVVIRDGTHIVIELKTSATLEALATLERKVRFYERRVGQPVQRRILVTPWFESGVKEAAQRMGWELYGEPEDLVEE